MIQPITQLVHMYYEDLRPMADPRTKDSLLVTGMPVQVWCLTIAYLLFVFVGTKWMRRRPAFSVKTSMVFYNIALVVLCLYITVEMILSTMDAGYGFFCAPYSEKTRENPRELRVANVLWWYFMTKAVELMDTVWMVLHKKFEQITCLHVIHHVTVLNNCWWLITFMPGGMWWFAACLNSFIHVIMYSYYTMSLFPSLQKKLWWKRYLTMFQMLQFAVILVHALNSMYIDCEFPRWGQYILCSQMIFMLTLFSNFYVQAYCKRHKD